MPEASAYPSAASSPESGTPTTTSASTGLTFERYAPAFFLAACTEQPEILESGRAVYTYSNTQRDSGFLLQ